MSITTMKLDFPVPEPASAQMPDSFVPGKKYFSAYIRMRTATYTVRRGASGPSFISDAANAEWENTCAAIAERCGLEFSKGFWYLQSDPVVRVHFHPDAISGELSPSLISDLEAAITAYPNLFRYETTDLYDRVGDLVDQAEVEKRFNYYRDQIDKAFVKACATRSTTKYVHVDTWLLAQRFPGLTVALAMTGFCPRRHMFKCFARARKELVGRGLLVEHPTIAGYHRKILPRERKANQVEGK